MIATIQLLSINQHIQTVRVNFKHDATTRTCSPRQCGCHIYRQQVIDDEINNASHDLSPVHTV